MPLATDVNLPRDVEPIFPDRCIRCGAAGPERRIRIWTSTVSVWSILSLLFSRPFSVRVPLCRACAPRMRMARFARLILTLGLAAAGVAVAVWVLGSYEGPGRRYMAIGIAIVCMLPFFAWETVFPPPIDLTAYSATVDYEFADPAYAREFAQLNGAAVKEE
jgi:hypothetical protein